MIRFLILTILIGIVFFTADYYKFNDYIAFEKWWILCFFITLTIYYFRIMSKGFENNREHLVQFSLIYKVSKLFLSIAFIGLLLYKGVQNPILFIITFFVLYLFYTSFEILYFNSKLRQN